MRTPSRGLYSQVMPTPIATDPTTLDLLEVIRLRYDTLGWTQQQAADKAGIDQSSFGKFLRGMAPALPVRTAMKVLRALGGKVTITIDFGDGETYTVTDD